MRGPVNHSGVLARIQAGRDRGSLHEVLYDWLTLIALPTAALALWRTL